VENSSFEDRVKRAKELLESLMDTNITLSKSVELYNNGIKELKEATKLLEEAKLSIKEVRDEQ
jgi:exodeoxyribonuclease VII small subunit